MQLQLAVNGGLLCDAKDGVYRGNIGIAEGRIAAITSVDSLLDADDVLDATGCMVMPGLLDPHVHLGHGAEHASEFRSEGRSALVGGITTLLTFYRKYPFNYQDLLGDLIGAGEDNCPVDFLVHLPLYTEQNLDEVPKYNEKFGIRSFKFFPGIRGEDAAKMTDLPHTGPMLGIDDAFVYEGMSRVATVPDGLAMYHAENPDINAACAARVKAEGRRDLRAWCDSRPDFGEAQSVQEALWWQKVTGCPLYVVHVSSALALEQIISAKRAFPDAQIYAETLPQYLTHTRDSEVGTLAKMSPPLRTTGDQERLWSAIAEGYVDTIGTDHGAFTRAEKADAWESRSGFPGMATMLPALITYGVRPGRISLDDLVRVCSYQTAQLFGIGGRKGTLRVGADGDLAVVDLENHRKVTPEMLQSRSDFSIYEGEELYGWPSHVVRRGAVLVRDGVLCSPDTAGGVYLAC
jgi:dihydropyrimidinase